MVSKNVRQARVLACAFLALLVAREARPQGFSDTVRLPIGRAPAEVRVFENAILLLHRGPFRGAAPAGADGVQLLDPTGRVLLDKSPGRDLTGATEANLFDATLTEGGQVVVSMVALKPGSAGVHVLVFYASSSAPAKVVVTAPFACVALGRAPGGGLWCVGPEVEKHNAGRSDFPFLHLFGEDGRLVRSVASRGEFPQAPRPWQGGVQLAAVGSDIVVWMGALRELVTISEHGAVRTRVPVGPPGVPDAQRVQYRLTTDGHLFSTVMRGDLAGGPATWRGDIQSLDSRGTWQSSGLVGLRPDFEFVGRMSQRAVVWDRRNQRLALLPVAP